VLVIELQIVYILVRTVIVISHFTSSCFWLFVCFVSACGVLSNSKCGLNHFAGGN